MSFSDDHTSPAAPFPGDSSGQIFDLPELVSGPPTNAERVVDTQSGFLVVVKRQGDRLALSMKRRLGTPPSSSVMLTPDESMKLSKILSTSLSAEEQIEAYEQQFSQRSRKRSFAASANSGETIPDAMPYLAGQEVGFLRKNAFVKYAVAVGLTLLMFGLGAVSGFYAGNVAHQSHNKKILPADVLAKEDVEHFVRAFIPNLLDFSPSTYKASQIQAMSAMTPALLDKYWQETHFPLDKRQLNGLSQGTHIMVTGLKQERLAANLVQVDVQALMADPANPKQGTPINLRLKLSVDPDGRIQVIEQQDLAAG